MKTLRFTFRYLLPKIKNILQFVQNLVRNNKISFYSVISKGALLNHCKINGYSYIGPYCLLNAVHVGRYSSIAPYVIIGGAEHSYWWYSTSHFLSKLNIGGNITTIGNDVWIGAHAVIKQGITIGNGAVIGAGAIVLQDVEPYSIVVGMPAKKIKMRFNNNTIQKIEESEFWNFSPKKASKILEGMNKLEDRLIK